MIPVYRLVFALAGIAVILVLIVIAWRLRRTRAISECVRSITLPRDWAVQELERVQEESRVSDSEEERKRERAATAANAQVCYIVTTSLLLRSNHMPSFPSGWLWSWVLTMRRYANCR